MYRYYGINISEFILGNIIYYYLPLTAQTQILNSIKKIYTNYTFFHEVTIYDT